MVGSRELGRPAGRRQRVIGAITVVMVAVAAQMVSALQALGGDDVYVLENLRSTSWSCRLFAFNVDVPAAGYLPWFTGAVFQRRFIRVPASALLWLESELFGLRAFPYHLVTIALLAASCWLLFRLLSRHVPVGVAAAASVLPALHPAASEVVSELCCQPIALAGLFSIATVAAWLRMRARHSAGAVGLVVVLCALAVTSYEAAIALPVFIVLADIRFGARDDSKARRWGPRLAVLCVVVAYVPWAISIRRGLFAPDTTPVRAIGEVLLALRYDSVAYVCKALGLFDPTSMATYWFPQRAGEAIAIVTAVGLTAGLVWLVRRSRLGTSALIGFALFLAPPLLTRASVSALNFPTLRQLYLPVLVGVPALIVALVGPKPRLRVFIPLLAWAAALAVESQVIGGCIEIDRDRGRLTESTAQLLASVPGDYTVVGVGSHLCGFAPSLAWPGSSVVGIPSPSLPDAPEPRLVAVDDHTLIARSEAGFEIRSETDLPEREPGPGRGPAWIALQPVELIARGSQRIAGATVTIEARDGGRITALRYRFDSSLSKLVFVRFRGCASPEKMALE
jgi:hypothetical protein